MQLDLTVTRPGDGPPVDIVLELDDVSAEDTVRAIELCDGIEPLAELARGVWNDRAADALLQAALERQLGEPIDGFSVDWGPFADLMADDPPDRAFEADIPMQGLI